MSLILFVVLPLCCLLSGKLLGLAVAASTFFSETGKDVGRTVSRWAMPLLPMIFVLAMVLGARGNAGHGFTLFGSQALFGMVCTVVFYSVPVLGLYVGVLYVLRDLTLGHRARG